MKTILLLPLSILLFCFTVSAQTKTKGTVDEELRYTSTILSYSVHYSVYLPPNYATSDTKYPVVYLLHGYKGDHTSWIKQGNIAKIMDKGIANGEITPMILIIPDGLVYWYINDYQNKIRYENFMFQEFIPFIDKTYKTIPDKEHRAVAGLSMGGYGSLVWAMKHPNSFSYCVALSAAMFTKDGLATMSDKIYPYMAMLYGAPLAKGNDRITQHFIENSPIEMAQTNAIDSLKQVSWLIECGNQDQLSAVNKLLDEEFTKRNVNHIYTPRDGKHNWKFWRTGIYHGLLFISKGFRNTI